jgi:hypothetical protein
MPIQKINLGQTTGDKTGDGARTVGQKVNENFEYLENKIDNQNRVLFDAGFSLSGNTLTINAGWQWQINGVDYTNPVAVALVIPFATAGKKRRDLIVMNTSSTFARVAGVEVAGVALAPGSLVQTLSLGVFNVTDSTVYGSNAAASFLGSITPSATPSGIGAAYWNATQAGTYTNFGNVVVNANSLAVISRNEAGEFSISQTEVDLSEYTKKKDNTRISFTFKSGITGEFGEFNDAFPGKTSDFIFCQGADKVISVCGNYSAYSVFNTINFYDADKIFISGKRQVVNTEIISVPEGAVFYRGCSANQSLDIYILGKTGVNLMPYSFFPKTVVKPKLSGFINPDGSIYNIGGTENFDFFIVKGALKISLFFTPFYIPESALNIAFYDADKLFISGAYSGNSFMSVSIPSKAFFARVSASVIKTCELIESINYENVFVAKEDVIPQYFIPEKVVIRKDFPVNFYLPSIAANKGDIHYNTKIFADKRCIDDMAIINPTDTNIKFTYNSNYIGESNITFIDPATVTLATQRFVLPIGDSLTANESGAWTNEFSRLLSGIGNPTGQITGLFSPLNLPIKVIGTRGNGLIKNEGRGSWQTNDYLSVSGTLHGATNAFWNPSTAEFDINYYLSQNNFYAQGVAANGSNLDVFIFTGWNDGVIPKDKLQELINKIKSKLSNVTIFLIGQQSPPFNLFTVSDHEKYRKIVSVLNQNDRTKRSLSQENSGVKHFPVKHLFNPKNAYEVSNAIIDHRTNEYYPYNYDHVHPSILGYGLIADIVSWQYLDYLKNI